METIEAKVAIPMLLRNATGGAAEVQASGATVQGLLDNLLAHYPLLRVHLYEESGHLRKHVLVLYNGQNLRWFDSLDIPASPGDQITILQAVSGG